MSKIVVVLLASLMLAALVAPSVADEVDVTDEVEDLILDLKDDSPDVRMHAANALGDIGDQRAVNPLIEALETARSEIQHRYTPPLTHNHPAFDRNHLTAVAASRRPLHWLEAVEQVPLSQLQIGKEDRACESNVHSTAASKRDPQDTRLQCV